MPRPPKPSTAPCFDAIWPVMFFFVIPVLVVNGCAHSTLTSGVAGTNRTTEITGKSPYSDLKESIESLLPDSLFPPSNIGMMVVSLADGQTLYELNPDLMFMPASNQKLFTSAAALSILGPDFRFQTGVSIDTTGIPTIYLRGSGDPLLTTADLDTLADVLGTLLPRGRDWLLAGDVSRFDDVPWGSGWMWDDEAEPDGMAITPLSVNGNTIRVLLRAGSHSGDTLAWAMDPPTRYVSIANHGITAWDTSGRRLRITRQLDDLSNTVDISGTLLPGDTASARVAIRKPAWYTLKLFSERLLARGIRCTAMALDTVPVTAREVCARDHGLDSIVTYMNRASDNLSAESLLKTIGAVQRGEPGTAEAGLSAVKAFLFGAGLDTTRMVLADGSGVSRYNLATVRGIALLLQAMHRDQQRFPIFFKSLAGPGEHGSLSRRMLGTPAERNLRAKTGTLRGASACSGYLRAGNGVLLAFSIIMQNFPGNARFYRQVQDRICVMLAQWGEKE